MRIFHNHTKLAVWSLMACAGNTKEISNKNAYQHCVARYLKLRRWLLWMHRFNFPFMRGWGPNLAKSCWDLIFGGVMGMCLDAFFWIFFPTHPEGRVVRWSWGGACFTIHYFSPLQWGEMGRIVGWGWGGVCFLIDYFCCLEGVWVVMEGGVGQLHTHTHYRLH